MKTTDRVADFSIRCPKCGTDLSKRPACQCDTSWKTEATRTPINDDDAKTETSDVDQRR